MPDLSAGVDAFAKAQKYCALQERCDFQVKAKLIGWGVPPEKVSEILNKLQEEGYIDNLRFAKLYARSKFNQLGWGRTKISRMLAHMRIPDEFVSSALEELNEEDYTSRIDKLLQKKLVSIKPGKAPMVIKQKLLLFALSKGFEKSLIFESFKRLKI